MLLDWLPLVHLSAGAYEAWVSPGAGGRLCRLVWHGPRGDQDLVTPVNAAAPFDEDHWPKQGAFPMLPYANRLKDACIWWDGTAHRVRPVAGQTHGLHGVGHRRIWQVDECSASAVRLRWQHRADLCEWPWSFTATLAYSLSASGLDVALAIRNDSATPMPSVLGWHPYVPVEWLEAASSGGMALAVHPLDGDGICHPQPGRGAPRVRPFVADLRTPHTLALEDWHSPWTVHTAGGERWCLSANAAHLVHHVPSDLAYVCIEPVTALPGALGAKTDLGARKDIELMPGTWRDLQCRLMMAP